MSSTLRVSFGGDGASWHGWVHCGLLQRARPTSRMVIIDCWNQRHASLICVKIGTFVVFLESRRRLHYGSRKPGTT